MQSPRETAPLAPVKFAVRDVWKMFGARLSDLTYTEKGTADPDLCRRLGLFTAVAGVSMDVRKGEVFVIMGLSGSGKSTLLRCICQLLRPTYGSVLLDGMDISKASERQLIELRRHRMGMVFQNYALLPNRTVADNIALPLVIQGATRMKRTARVTELVHLVGLGGKEYAYPAQLSGGQQQRVGIARSLAVDPEIWLLDEPFSALDPLIRRELQNEIIRLQSVVQKTVLFITHDFDEAVRLATRIAIMRDGRLVQVGTPEELILYPADDYVADFTRHVDRSRVLTAAAVVAPKSAGVAFESVVSSDARVSDIVNRVIASATPIGVRDAEGRTLGIISKDRLLELMLPTDPANWH